jgi:MFS family permease
MEDTTTRKSPQGYPPHNRTFYLAIASICICSFMSSIDTVIVASALPRIAQALHATSVEAYWCGTGFLFAQTVSQPIYGAFTSVVGMKVCILVAMGVFLVASVFCAAAQNIAWLIAARVVGTVTRTILRTDVLALFHLIY